MVRKFSSIAFAGALMLAAAPAFAQDLGDAINGLTAVPGQVVGGVGQGLGLDLDPLHIFTPVAAPVAPAPMMHHHHHMMMHHKHMMMHHKKKMMMHKKMMKKEEMKK